MRGASRVVALLALVALDLTVFNPQRGRALLHRVTGGAAGSAGTDADPLTPDQIKELVKQGKDHYEAARFQEALSLFERAAAHESSAALFWVAWLHDPNREHAGIKPDPAKALDFYRRASVNAEDEGTRTRCEKQIAKLLETHPELGR